MRIVDILTPKQVSLAGENGSEVTTKEDAIARLAELLCAGGRETAGPAGHAVGVAEIERVLSEREQLQSTGVGGGVAIPHGAIERLERIYGAVLLCPNPIGFEAIDGAPVGILFAVVGPKKHAEHLKTLARVSRLLRDEGFRNRLLAAPNGAAAFELIRNEEERVVS
jgi:PTS system nitrogen regulatory IIA component